VTTAERDRVLYDDRVNNAQRLVISKLMESANPILSARIKRERYTNHVAVMAFTAMGAYRIDSDGRAWKLR
jgi:hypothetical protein